MTIASTGSDLRIGAADHSASRDTVVVARDFQAVAPLWQAVERQGIGTPFQTRAFVEAWFAHLGGRAEPLIVAGQSEWGGGYVIPLAVRRVGPARVATFPGDSHANTNVGLFDPAVWARFSPADVQAVYRAIATARPEVDLVELRAQPLSFAGRDNPFVDDRSRPSPHMAYVTDLDGDFGAVLSRHKGGKKRSSLRQREKHLSRFGEVRTVRAATASQARQFLETFFAQKAERFRQQGIPDVFADEPTRAFFRALCDTVDSEGLVQIRALSTDEGVIATIFLVTFAGATYLLMNSFCLGDAARYSPGEVLLFRTIEDCAAEGLAVFDFGVGDARYKRSWCDREVTLLDTLVPLTPLGGATAAAMRGKRALRDFVVARPALHRFVQRLRSGQTSSGEDGGGED